MNNARLLVTLNFLFFTVSLVSAAVQTHAIYDDSTTQTKKYEIRHSLILTCNVTSDGEAYKLKWEKDGVEVVAKEKTKFDQKGSIHTLRIDRAGEDEAGNYSCIAYKGDEELHRSLIVVGSTVRVKVPDNVNVVEGEKLRIHCQVFGRPTPFISWEIGNETYTESRDRVKLLPDERNITNSILVIEEIEMTDRNEYTCIGSNEVPKTRDESKAFVRIKDKYAALWPFLGICAEVFVLCAIILIYEKKRNKTELEESDTDQSPDQKNTPDHGKDSNLRHRQ